MKSPRSTRMRHRQWRELFETFTLFFSLTLLLLCAGFVMQAIKAPDWVAITGDLIRFAMFRSICPKTHLLFRTVDRGRWTSGGSKRVPGRPSPDL